MWELVGLTKITESIPRWLKPTGKVKFESIQDNIINGQLLGQHIRTGQSSYALGIY